MWRILPILLVCALAAPLAATARSTVPGDGTLSVRNGDGQVRMLLRGAVIGKVESGRLTVIDPARDCEQLLVWETDVPPREWTTTEGETACTFSGTDLRFRFVGGLNELRVVGDGIFLSAVGKGSARLRGTGGTYSVDGSKYVEVPAAWVREQIGVTVP
jgi:hypothetical protein